MHLADFIDFDAIKPSLPAGTKRSLLLSEVTSTQRSSLKVIHTLCQSSFSARSCSNNLTGVRPPDTTRLALPLTSIASARSTLISPESACASASESGKRCS